MDRLDIRDHEHTSDTFPNFFIVGAAKAGTTSLYRYLDQHPDVYMPSVKEPHWFSRVEPNPQRGVRPVTTDAEYLALFKGRENERAVGEASPSYLWDVNAPERIKNCVPEARIIVSLRAPIDRAFSHYLMDMREGWQTKPFYEALREDYLRSTKGWGVSHLYVELGLYAAQLTRYLECFGHDRVLVIFFEEFVSDVHSTLTSIATFLRIEPSAIPVIGHGVRHNSFAVPRGRLTRRIFHKHELRALSNYLPKNLKTHLRDKIFLRQAEKPEIGRDAYEFLQSIYRPEVSRLEKLLGRALPWKM